MCVPFSVYLFINDHIVLFICIRKKFEDSLHNSFQIYSAQGNQTWGQGELQRFMSRI